MEILHIGICDDNKEDLKHIEAVLRKEIGRTGISCEILCCLFLNGNEAYEACIRVHYHMFFLDIEMPDTDGFKLAKKICLSKASPYLFFVSAHESFVFDSMEYMPLRFVRKSMLERDMHLALRKYFEITASKRISYRLKEGIGHKELLINDVIYIECQGHLLIIQKRDGKVYKQYGSLKAMEEELACYKFIRIHKSYLVNQKYIEEIGRHEVRLVDGTLLEMGRDRRKFLCEEMAKYERERNGGH